MRAMNPTPNARLLSVQQVSTEIGIPLDSLDKLISRGHLPVVELPGIRRRFVDRSDLEACLESWKRVAR